MQEQQIINIWQDCQDTSQLYKAVALASLLAEDVSLAEIAEWSVEKRDTTLFELRKYLFGNQLTGISNCPSCQHTVEWDFLVENLSLSPSNELPENTMLSLLLEGKKYEFRLPNSNDLLLSNEQAIIENCCLSENGAGSLSENLIAQVHDRFDKSCRASNISYRLICSECESEWQVLFDIVSYLWTEIDDWTKQFLNQVFFLAKHMGWSEKDIIEMNPHRRNYYLQLYYAE